MRALTPMSSTDDVLTDWGGSCLRDSAIGSLGQNSSGQVPARLPLRTVLNCGSSERAQPIAALAQSQIVDKQGNAIANSLTPRTSETVANQRNNQMHAFNGRATCCSASRAQRPSAGSAFLDRFAFTG
jgi:hypothetical protein